MKTDDLIAMLAQGAGPAPRHPALPRLAPALAGGGVLALALAVGVGGPVPAALLADPRIWLKIGYAAALAAAAAWLAARLGRPLPRVAGPGRTVAAVVAVMAAAGAAALALAPEGQRAAELLGHSWQTCPRSVVLLSLPALAGVLRALRGMAPTRPRAAGFAAGVLAGAVGAFAYAFTCTEVSPAFVAAWYTLGVVLTGALGAALGPRVLRW